MRNADERPRSAPLVDDEQGIAGVGVIRHRERAGFICSSKGFCRHSPGLGRVHGDFRRQPQDRQCRLKFRIQPKPLGNLQVGFIAGFPWSGIPVIQPRTESAYGGDADGRQSEPNKNNRQFMSQNKLCHADAPSL